MLSHALDMGYLISSGKYFSSHGAVPFSAYGERVAAGAEASRPVWPNGTFIVPPSTGIQMAVSSDSANDTAAGTGIRSVHIHYIQAGTLEEKTEIVTLNGLTPVNTVATDIRFVQCMHMHEYGSLKVSDGNISLKDTGGTNTYSYIATSAKRCSSSARMVPGGKVGYVMGAVGGSISSTADAGVILRMGTSYFEGHDYTDDSILIDNVAIPIQNSSIAYRFPMPLGPIPEGTIIGVLGETDKAATIGASWFGWHENA